MQQASQNSELDRFCTEEERVFWVCSRAAVILASAVALCKELEDDGVEKGGMRARDWEN